ncbi:MAG: acetyl-CoA C-acyltransferase [Bacteroidota bacterium]
MQAAYIISGFRSAVGKAGKGGLRFTRPDDLAAAVIKHLLASVPELDPVLVDDLLVGNAVPEAEAGMQMGRMIALQCLPVTTGGMIVNRYCGSGLEAIAIATDRIRCGNADCIIAGGAESMSMVPIMGYRTSLSYTLADKHPDYYTSMGLTAEKVAAKYGITREQQDAFALSSHQKAVEAISSGKFKSQVVPIEVEEVYANEKGKRATRNWTVETDEGPRADTSPEALAKLKPVFAAGGSVTAGNSSQTSDGAAFAIVMSERLMKQLGLSPVAELKRYAIAGVEPHLMGIGPIAAIPKVLKLAGLTKSDIAQTELNEAFAAQALAVIQQLDLNPECVNVNGGAIALGHPLGCSGAKLSVQLWNEMKLRKQKYGMVTACVGGGQGVAGIYEVF